MFAYFRDLFVNPFLLSGLLSGILAAVACGLIGPFVMGRRITFLAGAIAHIAVAGVGISLWLRAVRPDLFAWLTPLHGATAVALVGAVAVQCLHHYAGQQADLAIGGLWAVGMALGVLFAKLAPGYQTDLIGYLFGNIAMVGWDYVWLLTIVDLVTLVVVLAFYKRFVVLCTDPDQLAIQGFSVFGTELLLLLLVAVVVICLSQVVGLILVLALLTMPAATAALFARTLGTMIALCTVLAVAVSTIPQVAVYGTALSAESAIVIAAAGVYIATLLVKKLVLLLCHRSAIARN